ncbi:hypothetical protein, partial [Brachybacterium phenoliresistens]|uniref:hypothetical protein n=1 Tax=Brachybacterium phenoliresistens TaxID=396014 RepID=UPI0031D76257
MPGVVFPGLAVSSAPVSGVLDPGVATSRVLASGISASGVLASGVIAPESGRVVGIVVLVQGDRPAEMTAVLTTEHTLMSLVVVHQMLDGHRADQIDIIDHIPDHVMPLPAPDQ